MADNPAGRLGRVVPPLECGYRDRAVERAVDVAELDDFTSGSPRAGPRDYSLRRPVASVRYLWQAQFERRIFCVLP